jgi:hypothetical protein
MGLFCHEHTIVASFDELYMMDLHAIEGLAVQFPEQTFCIVASDHLLVSWMWIHSCGLGEALDMAVL